MNILEKTPNGIELNNNALVIARLTNEIHIPFEAVYGKREQYATKLIQVLIVLGFIDEAVDIHLNCSHKVLKEFTLVIHGEYGEAISEFGTFENFAMSNISYNVTGNLDGYKEEKFRYMVDSVDNLLS